MEVLGELNNTKHQQILDRENELDSKKSLEDKVSTLEAEIARVTRENVKLKHKLNVAKDLTQQTVIGYKKINLC